MVECEEDYLLKIYLREINAIPLLTKAEEKKLVERARNGDEESKNKLITSNLRYVVSLATNYKTNGLTFLDLISEGNDGLISTIERYDSTRGSITNYARWWVTQSIKNALSDKSRNIRISRNLVHKLRFIEKFKYDFLKENQRIPTSEEILEKIQLPNWFTKTRLISLEDTASLGASEFRDVVTGEELIGDYKYNLEENFLKKITTKNLRTDFEKVFNENLSFREVEVIKYRFGFKSGRYYTLEETGDELGITKEGVRQIQKRALEKLKKIEILKEYL
ncbi:MAG: sigma-70 family RNA polymerase sigma factor [Candidatus ainarchaeum sp.]|nr:sigma-70 family RNA polymerase sigma factor [Candidatus ainarchaeum sp.]